MAEKRPVIQNKISPKPKVDKSRRDFLATATAGGIAATASVKGMGEMISGVDATPSPDTNFMGGSANNLEWLKDDLKIYKEQLAYFFKHRKEIEEEIERLVAKMEIFRVHPDIYSRVSTSLSGKITLQRRRNRENVKKSYKEDLENKIKMLERQLQRKFAHRLTTL